MNNANLFEQPATEKTVAKSKTSKPKKTTFYNKYDLVSLLIKSMRLGDEKLAITTMRCMLNEGVSETYIARKCVHFASEDAIVMQIYTYACSVHDFIKNNGSEINSLSRLIIELCNAEKFRHTRKEADREVWRIHLREKIKKQYKNGTKPMEMPDRVYDQYTAKGKAQLKRWEKIDLRYSGVLQGWLFLRKQYLYEKKLLPNSCNLNYAYADDIMECLEQWMSYDEYVDLKNEKMEKTKYRTMR